MTPLAQRYFGQLMLKKADRAPDPFGALRSYEDLHCFEVSQIHDPIVESINGRSVWDTVCQLPGPFFLPAPATWLESRCDDHTEAMLIVDRDPGWLIYKVLPALSAVPCCYVVPPEETCGEWDVSLTKTPGLSVTDEMKLGGMARAMFMVDVINTPSLIELVEHESHRGFDRRFRNSVGGYPLHGWHEVKINPGAIREVSDPDGISGRKCLHFVRKHRRRLQDGRETLVAAHWRGDPAIGMMRTRYTVAALRNVRKNFRRAGG